MHRALITCMNWGKKKIYSPNAQHPIQIKAFFMPALNSFKHTINLIYCHPKSFNYTSNVIPAHQLLAVA